MRDLILNLVRDEGGQDLVEYTLLLAFITMASAALFINGGQSITGIWNLTESRLDLANSTASS